MTKSTIASRLSTLRKNYVWLILVLALCLRLPLLNGSLWLDEAAQALESARPLSQQLHIIPDFQPPLIHVVLHFVQYASMNEAWMRWWVALVPGLGSLYFTIRIAEHSFGKRLGAIVGLLLATSSFHIFYSQELRPYALPTFFATWSWWLLLSGSLHTKRVYGWVVLAGVSILGWYSSYLYPFIWLAQSLWLVVSMRTKWRQVAAVTLAPIIAFIPWLPIFWLQLQAGGAVRTGLPGWSEVVSFTQLKSIPLVLGKFVFGVVELGPYLWQTIMVGVVTLLCAVACGAFLKHSKKSSWRTLARKWGWLILWLVLPLTLAWIVSFKIPVIQPKRVLWLLPAFYLAIAWLSNVSRSVLLKYGIVASLLAVNIWGTLAYWTQPALQREDWRAAYDWVSTRYQAEKTLVVFAFDEPFAPWRWYDTAEYQTLAFGTGTFSIAQVPYLRQHLSPVESRTYIVTFDYLTDLSDPQDRLHGELEAYGFQEVDMIAYPQIGFVRVWARPASLLSQQ